MHSSVFEFQVRLGQRMALCVTKRNQWNLWSRPEIVRYLCPWNQQSASRIFRNVLDYRSDSRYLRQKIYETFHISRQRKYIIILISHSIIYHIFVFFNNYCIYLSYTCLCIHDIGYGTCLYIAFNYISVYISKGDVIFNGERGILTLFL